MPQLWGVGRGVHAGRVRVRVLWLVWRNGTGHTLGAGFRVVRVAVVWEGSKVASLKRLIVEEIR